MIVRRFLLASFIVLFPFYVLPSGVPQPSHVVLAAALAFSAVPLVAMLRTTDRAILIPLGLFIAYAAIVNGYYSLALETEDTSLRSLPIVRTAYLAFNGGVFAVFLLHVRHGGVRELRFLVACLVGGVAVLAVMSMLYPVWDDDRLVASFNNPNQLGYYALIVLTTGLAYSLRGGMSVPVTAMMTAACVYLIARSLSVAAIGALLLSWVLIGIQALRTRRTLALALLLSFVPLAGLGWFTRGEAVLAALERRSERLERLYAYFARDRHLNWLVQYPEHLILGAGEGASERFYTSRDAETDIGAEVHSTLGVVLFAYGIPGTVLVLLFLWRLVRADPAHAVTLIVPLLVYGLAHNGLRFSFLWFCLAVVYCTARIGDLKGEVAPIALTAGLYRRYGKPVFDRVAAVLGLVLLAPLLLVVAAAIRVSIGSPVFFRHRRPGLHGLPFTLIKFRTMTDARDEEGRLLPDAARATRLGRLLRTLSIDELPELYNVLRGDMSLIGPRPLLMQHLERYDAHQARRHEVLPGITGWAQVHGRKALSWQRKCELDVWYVDHVSAWLDLRILVLTLPAVVTRRGSPP